MQEQGQPRERSGTASEMTPWGGVPHKPGDQNSQWRASTDPQELPPVLHLHTLLHVLANKFYLFKKERGQGHEEKEVIECGCQVPPVGRAIKT